MSFGVSQTIAATWRHSQPNSLARVACERLEFRPQSHPMERVVQIGCLDAFYLVLFRRFVRWGVRCLKLIHEKSLP